MTFQKMEQPAEANKTTTAEMATVNLSKTRNVLFQVCRYARSLSSIINSLSQV